MAAWGLYHQEALESGWRNRSLAITPNLTWGSPATCEVISPVTPADFCYGHRRDSQPLPPCESTLWIWPQVPYRYMGSL